MDSLFTPLTVDPTPLVLMTWRELEQTFGGFRRVEGSSGVYVTEDYAVKVVPLDDRNLSNEIDMTHLLNSLAPQTQVFSHGEGYILSMEHPSSSSSSQQKDDEMSTPPEQQFFSPGFAYLFSERIDAPFSQLPDEPQINEDYYFEVLVGLYHARKTYHFTHWDIHSGNLMFNRLKEPSSRTYQIRDQFFVTIRHSSIQPKLIDYGKSAADPSYSDAQWREPRFKKLWNKSDIYHLSLIFSHRQHLSHRFRSFLEERVLPRFRAAMYATRLENDSAANFLNIEHLLRDYFGGQESVQCVVCMDGVARFVHERRAFCGEACKKRWMRKFC